MGQRASTGLTMFNQFWSYITPLGGAWLADEYWGRYNTIQYSNYVAIVGHIILIMSAIPAVIVKPNVAIAIFSVGLLIMGIGTGGFKSNISPLIAEQYKDQRAYVRVKKNGNKEIVDPATTTARIYLYFYFLINCGSICGSIAMVYSEVRYCSTIACETCTKFGSSISLASGYPTHSPLFVICFALSSSSQ
jgi:POT family proton-dependent oligopeptide transporter